MATDDNRLMPAAASEARLTTLIEETVRKFRSELPEEHLLAALHGLSCALKPPPRAPGRPRHDRITRAQQLREVDGEEWIVIFAREIPGWRTMSHAERKLAGENLKKAVDQRKREARKKLQQGILAPINGPVEICDL